MSTPCSFVRWIEMLAAVPGLLRMTSLGGVVLIGGMGAAGCAQQIVAAPSGQHIVLNEVLIDESPGETWARFRFIAPEIARQGGGVSYDIAANDMDYLCRELALPYLSDHSLSPARIVISLSDRTVPFGASDPEATQFFEAYRSESSGCIWEEY